MALMLKPSVAAFDQAANKENPEAWLGLSMRLNLWRPVCAFAFQATGEGSRRRRGTYDCVPGWTYPIDPQCDAGR